MQFFQTVLADRIVGAYANASPGTGWTSVSSFPALIANARTAALPLFLLPGTYPSQQIDINKTTSNGNPLTLNAQMGEVVVQLSGAAPYLMSVNGVSNVKISNIIFDGGNIALNDGAQTAALIHFTAAAANFVFEDCTIRNCTKTGVDCDSGANGHIVRNNINNCDIGVFCIDSGVRIEQNNVSACSNNGIVVFTSNISANTSVIADNYISNISSKAGGTGQYGNGINVFRATGVRVLNNVVSSCNYSAIRLNAAGNCIVDGNYCSGSRETAIWFEAPGAGLNLTGGICSNNIVDGAGSGIQVVNSGLYGDGVSRKVTVSANQVSNISSTFIPEENAYTSGCGIIAEGSCNLVGNNIENVVNLGIALGTNNATADLVACGNLIRNCPMGIGYSANPAAVGILVSGNQISGYNKVTSPSGTNYAHSGAIVSASFNGATYYRDASGSSANVDYGNATQTVVGPLTVGMNKAH